ncbi:uncharacterized protein PGTG_19903 [Puccinia graminis f. sp. tritici CRL 75-36-700-3]|uniref:Uncharacterized protein n=1 Tax=Puccinia graminis f. sp. tritici (strain CRL 75-36-700-3 / race SCCL) TaxID=418459 RepID=E3LBG5_PUCGT|nr:uncharacterized protein PGTG_19903 [Puccinia graminis f. sp. tritici CRL 75-36-700-3]EFP93890.1 hypothetical protein PGTG_19903 [Puccinia graminis f. sp. tritici CRL 75-36-700-3]
MFTGCFVQETAQKQPVTGRGLSGAAVARLACALGRVRSSDSGLEGYPLSVDSEVTYTPKSYIVTATSSSRLLVSSIGSTIVRIFLSGHSTDARGTTWASPRLETPNRCFSLVGTGAYHSRQMESPWVTLRGFGPNARQFFLASLGHRRGPGLY